MTKGKHTHDMKPDRVPMPTVYKCTSCAFKCIPAVLSTVRAKESSHIAVKTGSKQAREVWKG